jgi:hypothetical protein
MGDLVMGGEEHYEDECDHRFQERWVVAVVYQSWCRLEKMVGM